MPESSRAAGHARMSSATELLCWRRLSVPRGAFGRGVAVPFGKNWRHVEPIPRGSSDALGKLRRWLHAMKEIDTN